MERSAPPNSVPASRLSSGVPVGTTVAGSTISRRVPARACGRWDAARDRHSLTRAEHERLAPLYLKLKPALEHEEEFIFMRMLVPIDKPTFDDREADCTIIHSGERLVEPRVVRCAFGG